MQKDYISTVSQILCLCTNLTISLKIGAVGYIVAEEEAYQVKKVLWTFEPMHWWLVDKIQTGIVGLCCKDVFKRNILGAQYCCYVRNHNIIGFSSSLIFFEIQPRLL